MESLMQNIEKDVMERKSEGESLDDIKKFIEDQEKEFQEQKEQMRDDESRVEPLEDTLAVASSVMDMILSESEAKIANSTNCEVKSVPQTLCTDDKGNNSMALSVGSKVEAKDFEEEWYPASITEVDYDEMEVLVHYENDTKKHDEWINVSSPRLRPLGSGPKKQPEEIPPEPEPEVKEEVKEEKPKLSFEAGERCLARWRDNRRFMATVNKQLENGNYEIVFDDGFHWTCGVIRLSKLKTDKQEPLTIDTNCKASDAALSPIYGPGPSNLAPTPMPAYHTHLFDPARDYLSSKIERRQMKRKLNIKEIFNIGQKRPKTQKSPKETKPVVRKPKVKRTAKPKPTLAEVKSEVKTELPDAVASIIGTVDKPDTPTIEDSSEKVDEGGSQEVKEGDTQNDKTEIKNEEATLKEDVLDANDSKPDHDPVLDEEVKLEKFDKQDEVKHEEVLGRIKEVIDKLEGGLKDETVNPVPKEEVTETIKEETPPEVAVKVEDEPVAKPKKVKMKKSKKLRLLQEKKVKKQVEKVKNELEEMKKQVEAMRQQMMGKPPGFGLRPQEMPESYLLPGMWCCKWLNGQPVGMVSEIECEVKMDANNKPALPRRSVQVEDKRLPEGWTKHMVRRSLGNSAGKWDVVLVSPENRRFHTKNEMRNYFENNPSAAQELQAYEHALLDFGVHLKLSRRMGWITSTPGGLPDAPVSRLPAGTLSSTSPLVKRRKLSLKKKEMKVKHKKRRLAIKLKLPSGYMRSVKIGDITDPNVADISEAIESASDQPPLEDGYVYVGSLKVQVIDNLLRCPAEGCFKNFRNNTLLKMHIKHYHRELRKMMGATPKVSDLAYARTMPETEDKKPQPDPKVIKVKLPRPKREELKIELKDLVPDAVEPEEPKTPVIENVEIPEPPKPKVLDSPKLRDALVNKPVKRPRVLLPVRRPDPEPMEMEHTIPEYMDMEPVVEIPELPPLDFEMAISTHTVTKPIQDKKKKVDLRKSFVPPTPSAKRGFSEDEDWFGVNSDVDTRSSFPRSGTPDSKSMMDVKSTLPVSSESNEEQKDANMYTFTENGERIKIVHMKREEIINCHCGFREEDGLMVQCELCLCWQHALCHNIQKESEVPEKYTCSICVNPRRGRRSQRFLHDQDRLYEGLLPGGAPSEPLRRLHELAGNLLRMADALHALRLKYYVATKKNHPKLYLWAEDWENGELHYTQEKLNSEYSDLNIMINTLGKENLPLKGLTMTPPSQDDDRYTQREVQLGSQSLLSGLLSSPGVASLDLPISTSELERLAKSVQQQEQEAMRVSAPQPEAAIENGACRERLLRHIARCHAIIDARLDSIEAQVAELESQDPSFEDDETADYFPRTKQTVQMLMRDLDTMEELGVIT